MNQKQTYIRSAWPKEQYIVLRPFVADIYESGNLEPQSVFCYITSVTDNVADVMIKMPLYLKPSAIRSDVQEHMREDYPDFILGDLKFELAPTNVTIHP